MTETTSQTVDRILYAASARMGAAIIKFPQPNYVLTKVAEEAGEVVKAGVHYAEGRDTWEHVEDEIIDTIAMCLRLAVEGDEIHGIVPKRN